MNFVLQWIAPPLVGAIIGFVTNAIAIKMLFRPLTEKRVFGLRVPFTPGILPRQRAKLARNIGKMVSRELLTEAIVRERLRTPQFRSLIEKSVAGYTSRLLDSSVSDLAAFASELPIVQKDAALPAPSSSSSDLSRSIGSLTGRFILSDSFATLVRTAARHAVDRIGTRTLSDLIGRDGSALPSFSALFDRFLGTLSSPEAEKRIAERIEHFLQEGSAAGRTIGSVLPESTAENVGRVSDLLYPAAVEALLRFLDERATRAELEAKGKVILRDAIQELNSFQRFFVSAAQYDRTLNERMPSIVDGVVVRISEAVMEDATRARFVDAVRRSAESLLSKSGEDALKTLNTDAAAFSRMLAGTIRAALGSASNKARIKEMLEDFLDSAAHEPIDTLLRNRLGLDPLALADMASFSLVSYLRAECPSAVPRLVDGFLREHGADSVSGLLGIDETEKTKWDAALSAKIVDLFDERVSAVIESLDVQSMVSERIDSLDMEDVERIVLDVLSGQLKWIDFFGAVLGALMGLFQSLFAVLLRS